MMRQTVAEVKNSEISVPGRDGVLELMAETVRKKACFERGVVTAQSFSLCLSGSHCFQHLLPAVEVAGMLPAVEVPGEPPAVKVAGKLKD